ncbi:MAG TPA: twin-arginine translocase subunit TatC [Solirubrobacteraceae bacterium]
MATAIRRIGHEERLSIVDHLEELRTRLIVSAIAFAVVFGVCFWQNHALLDFINRPLHKQTEQQVLRGEGPAGATWLAQKGVLQVAKDTQSIARALSTPASGLPVATRTQLAGAITRLQADVAKIPRSPSGIDPTTLGPGEPLTATLTVTLYFSLVLALPLILFELYGFLLPAFSPAERRVVMPLLLSVPFLFAAGAAFGYLVVLPTAVHFLQNFNSSQFNVMVQANQYYKFAATVLLAMGLSFQAPVVILGAVRAGLVTPRQLRRNRRYAILLCAAVAAFLPGDAFTLVLEAVPLYLLYEASILIASVLTRRDAARATATGAGRPPEDPPSSQGATGTSGPLAPSPSDGPGSTHGHSTALTDPQKTTAQEMIDHIDPDLSS